MLDGVELITKVFVLLGGVCYALGLIVVSIHLYPYGIHSLSLLELSYVIAGLWTLCPILVAVLGSAASVYISYQFLPKGEPRFKQLRLVVLVGAYPVFVYGFFGLLNGLLWLQNSSFRLGLGSWLRISSLGLVVFLSLTGSIALVRRILKHGRRDELADLALEIAGLPVVLLILVCYAFAFANGAYKEIPAELGGGRMGQVSFIVDSASKPYLQTAGLQFRSDSNRSLPVDLVLATDREYAVLLKSTGPATSIPNTVVKAVLHEGR